jgi:hypothetical protein
MQRHKVKFGELASIDWSDPLRRAYFDRGIRLSYTTKTSRFDSLVAGDILVAETILRLRERHGIRGLLTSDGFSVLRGYRVALGRLSRALVGRV